MASKNAEHNREVNRRYCELHRDRLRAIRKAYRQKYNRENRDAIRAQCRAYYEQNTDAVKAKSRDWAKANPDKQTAYAKKKRAGRTGYVSPEAWLAICAEHDNRCAYCLQRAPLTQDHFLPISRGGLHQIENIVPACQSCNSRKHNRLVFDFVPQMVSP